MKFILRRKQFQADGIFGVLLDGQFRAFCLTLEHAYGIAGSNRFGPKLQPGEYVCFRRPSNRFKREVFEIRGVEHDPEFLKFFGVESAPKHTAMLFHPGNTSDDSEGCILLGTSLQGRPGGRLAIGESKAAFDKFMKALEGVDEFTLVVEKLIDLPSDPGPMILD